jgi:hypothetical protein
MYFAMQLGIRAGSPPHVSSAVKVLQHQADLQGLIAKDTNPGLQAFVVNIHLHDDPAWATETTSESPEVAKSTLPALPASGGTKIT